MGIFKITGYHGTDLSAAEKILHNGFHCKNSKEHWLGDGIYLYKDRRLAEWWTTNPTEKHGMTINDPVIIECFIETDEERVLNICNLDNYKEYVNLYNSFFREWSFRAKSKEEANFKQLRCAFFNYLLLMYDVDMIIAPFVLPDQPYMPQYFNNTYANKMHIMYTEIQICIPESRQEIIRQKIVHKLVKEWEK